MTKCQHCDADILSSLEVQSTLTVVAWRYQGKEGWGDIWRCTTIPVSFETPADWIVQPLYADLSQPHRMGTTPAFEGTRETIATIIDPVAAYHSAGVHTAGYKSAYEKADAIITALTATPDDPFNRRQVEAICRAVCVVEGVDPDSDVYGDGCDTQWSRYADAVADALYATPSLMGTTPEMQKMYGEFDGLGWREYMRGIENGNIDPTGERLRAVCKLAREALAATPARPQPMFSGNRDPLKSIAEWMHETATPAVGGEEDPCPYCSDGKQTGLPGNACENCMNTGLKYPERAQPASPLRGRVDQEDLREAMMCLFIKMNNDRPPIDTQIGALIELFDAAISDYRDQSAAPPEQPAADPVRKPHDV